MKLSTKLMIVFLAVGVIPLATVGSISLFKSKAGLHEQAFHQLDSINAIKSTQIESFFNRRISDAKVLAANPNTLIAYKEMAQVFQDEGSSEAGSFIGKGNFKYSAPSSYQVIHEKYYYGFKTFMEEYDYYDVFLMDLKNGEIVFTVFKEADFGKNLSGFDAGMLKDAWTQARTGKVYISDMAPYAPSAGAPAQFVAAPILEDDAIIGVLALQISTGAFNTVMGERTGLGESGETFLVGQDHLMRSDSFLDPTNFSVAASFDKNNKAQSQQIIGALSGEKGNLIGPSHSNFITGKDNSVMASYSPVNVGNRIWALVAEIDESEAMKASNAIQLALLIVSFVGILAISGVSVLMARSITGPINRVIEGMQTGSDQVANSSQQISSASQQLADGASTQASSLEETSASLEEMASTSNASAQNTQLANQQSSEVKVQAERGQKSMVQLVEAMKKIEASSDETAKIIKTIDEIAFQTNLLALNAAVAAARAGDAGKGFAVVAEEVRNLAQRSAEAAKGTADLIDSSQENSKRGVASTNEVSSILEDVVKGILEVADLIQQISSGAEEQARSVSEINKAVSQLDTVTQTNAAGAEESASASEQMSAQAIDMKNLVHDLTAIINGNKTGRQGSSRFEPGPARPLDSDNSRFKKKDFQGAVSASPIASNPDTKPLNNSRPSMDEVILLDEESMIEL